jgi:hypothetical protein
MPLYDHTLHPSSRRKPGSIVICAKVKMGPGLRRDDGIYLIHKG